MKYTVIDEISNVLALSTKNDKTFMIIQKMYKVYQSDLSMPQISC